MDDAGVVDVVVGVVVVVGAVVVVVGAVVVVVVGAVVVVVVSLGEDGPLGMKGMTPVEAPLVTGGAEVVVAAVVVVGGGRGSGAAASRAKNFPSAVPFALVATNSKACDSAMCSLFGASQSFSLNFPVEQYWEGSTP